MKNNSINDIGTMDTHTWGKQIKMDISSLNQDKLRIGQIFQCIKKKQ